MCRLFRGKPKPVPIAKPDKSLPPQSKLTRTSSDTKPTRPKDPKLEDGITATQQDGQLKEPPPSRPEKQVPASISPSNLHNPTALESTPHDDVPKLTTPITNLQPGQEQPFQTRLQPGTAPSNLKRPPSILPQEKEPDVGEANSDSGATQLHNRHKQSYNILGQPFQDVESYYTIGRELGRGEFRVTYVCTEKSTGRQYACKSILKRRLMNKNDKEDVKMEVQIMRLLSGTPNVVQFKGAYEDIQSVHIVMELCTGGGIFDRIIDKGHISERAAATICRQVVNAVNACHCKGVVIMDLKPERFLFSSKDEEALLKLTDFRFSVFIEDAKSYQDRVQNTHYVAPEVLQHHYGKEIDVWSAGIILYILLSGVPPFKAETEKGIVGSISKGHIDFEMKPWPDLSSYAVDLVEKMLMKDPGKRITSAQVLQHPWIKDGDASHKHIDVSVIAKLKQFRAMNKFKKFAPKVISERLSEEQIRSLKVLFTDMDWKKSGTITYEAFKRGLDTFRSKLAETELYQLISAADADGNRTIDYNEFITATLHLHGLERNGSL